MVSKVVVIPDVSGAFLCRVWVPGDQTKVAIANAYAPFEVRPRSLCARFD